MRTLSLVRLAGWEDPLFLTILMRMKIRLITFPFFPPCVGVGERLFVPLHWSHWTKHLWWDFPLQVPPTDTRNETNVIWWGWCPVPCRNKRMFHNRAIGFIFFFRLTPPEWTIVKSYVCFEAVSLAAPSESRPYASKILSFVSHFHRP